MITILDGVVLTAAIGVIRLIWDSMPNPALWVTHQDGWGMRVLFATTPCAASLDFP
ncbi:hypothetical protein [Planctomyces sp. SH-PL62]|uniref:hypothetical protein n=1 Tax=Planctomyces sp. SH-PL62 TaxID=1636152 RepID=UPI0012E8F9E9|nr:hypothetical protein [Planctomyces sp. SH-PL62]